MEKRERKKITDRDELTREYCRIKYISHGYGDRKCANENGHFIPFYVVAVFIFISRVDISGILIWET